MATTRTTRKKIALVTLLAVLLLATVAYYVYYSATKSLSIDFTPTSKDSIKPPKYLFQFAGSGDSQLVNPIGVIVDNKEVLVVDNKKHVVRVFDIDGNYVRSFGEADLANPVYIAKNPTDNTYFVNDRVNRRIVIFDARGTKTGEYTPQIPKDKLPDLKETDGLKWFPMAMTFDADGAFYVIDMLKGHRLLVFNPDGSFRHTVGNIGIANDRTAGPGIFQFPSAIAVDAKSVFVSDSNNGRIQVFSKSDLTYEKMVITKGLPRGIVLLQPFSGDDEKTPKRIVTMDTLGHMGTIWNEEGSQLANFGSQGSAQAQFSYPENISLGEKNKMYIADSLNARIQVWGWPDQISPIPIPKLPSYWPYCCLPLLLLPFLLLLRRKKVFATEEFVLYSLDRDEGIKMVLNNKVSWIVLEEIWEKLKDVKVKNPDTNEEKTLSQVLTQTAFSQQDVDGLVEKYEIPVWMATNLAVAKRKPIFATLHIEERKYARLLEVDVVDYDEALKRFSPKEKKNSGKKRTKANGS